MKKHPVDELFRRKLGELEKKPSDNAWLKIQAERKPVRRGIGWIWYAAASLTVGLFAGYLIWQNGQADLQSPVENRTLAKVAATEQLPEIVETDSASKQIDIQIQKNTLKEAVLARVEKKQVAKHVKAYGNAEELINKEKITVEIIEKPAVNTSSNALAEARLPEVLANETQNAGKSVEDNIKSEAEPARTIVVAVESDLNETNDKSKTSKFSRVFRQLKNARAGERVDWDEMGFNPKTLVAKVDDRLRGKEEKGLENETPKHRTKL